MITFKSTQDLNKLTTDNPAHPIIQELIEQLIRAYTWEGHPYFTEDYGYIILIEPEDTDRILDEIWDDWTLLIYPGKASCFVTASSSPSSWPTTSTDLSS